jgi:hypothetical protein
MVLSFGTLRCKETKSNFTQYSDVASWQGKATRLYNQTKRTNWIARDAGEEESEGGKCEG